MTAIAITLWLHLFGPAGDGCVPELLAREVAPMPRPVPVLRVPERWGPRIVIPPNRNKEK